MTCRTIVVVVATAATFYVVIQIWIGNTSGGSATSAFPAVVEVSSLCGGVVLDSGLLATAEHCPVSVGDAVKDHDLKQVAVISKKVACSKTNGLAIYELDPSLASLLGVKPDTSDLSDGVAATAVSFGATVISGILGGDGTKRQAFGAIEDANATGTSLEPAATTRLSNARFCPEDSGGAVFTSLNGKNKLIGIIQGAAAATTYGCSNLDYVTVLDADTLDWINRAHSTNVCP